jgi:DNA-binding response OmpR family regulator
LGNLIDEIIEFSRMEIRGVQLHHSLFSVRRLLQEAVASVKPQLLAKDLVLELRETEALRRMWGDRKRVAQVLAILLSNAIKFSHKGGHIVVGASLGQNGAVHLDVEDSGIGIDAESQKRVFDKFYQADSSRTRRYEGAGIGLSIAKSIMDAHGGTIALRSEPGIGSTFTLVFPDAFFDDRESAETESHGEAGNVLVVSGDTELTSAIRRVLTSHAFAAVQVASGYEAARMMHECEPTFVIVNEELPSLNPVAVVQHLIEQGMDSDVGVLLLAEKPGNLDQSISARSNIRVLYKPFSSDDLIRRLKRLQEVPILPPGEEMSLRPTGAAQVALLCISPDSDLQEWIETAFRRRGLPCVRAENAASALSVIAKRTPRVVLADLDVPGEEAVELLNGVREATGRSGGTFYVMTGLSEDTWDYVDIAGILKKPFTTRELVETITSAVAGSVET